MKTWRENKAVNHAVTWEGPTTQFWVRYHLLQSIYQAGSRVHHSISKCSKYGMHTMEGLPMGNGYVRTK
eukprot:10892584-Prorocentrum_lima.AAC.1